MVEFERVIDGLARYINGHVYSGMNDWQEILARMAVGRIIGNPAELKKNLMNNGIVKTFAVMDSEGNVDLEPLMKDFKKEIERKGEVTFEIPLFGKMSFVPADVDDIYREITGGVL